MEFWVSSAYEYRGGGVSLRWEAIIKVIYYLETVLLSTLIVARGLIFGRKTHQTHPTGTYI